MKGGINVSKGSDSLLKALEIVKTLASLDMTVVPIEPSLEMIDAVNKIDGTITKEKIKEIYAAMLLAHEDKMLV